MAHPVDHHAAAPIPHVGPAEFVGTSIARIVICALPIIGTAALLISNCLLDMKIGHSRHTREWIDLAHVKNNLHTASLINTVLTLALLITPIALGIFGTVLSVISAIYLGFLLSRVPDRITAIIHNNRLIEELKRDGYDHHMQIK